MIRSRTKMVPAAWALIVSALFVCAQPPRAVQEAKLGSSLSPRGTIVEKSLVFRFRPYTRGGTVRDLFNYFYFEGDTICFSFLLSKPVTKRMVSVEFYTVDMKNPVRAERLEVEGGRVYGFSLVGSLMEHFYHDRLKHPVPGDLLCCQNISFAVRLVAGEMPEQVEHVIKDTFRIVYESAQ